MSKTCKNHPQVPNIIHTSFITRIIVFFSPSGTLEMLGNGSRNSELCLVSGKLVLRVRDTIVLKLELAHSFVIYQLQLFGQLE